MRQTAIQFYSHEMAVEGVLSTPSQSPQLGAKSPQLGSTGKSGLVIVCHPHPLLGGDMDNAVVTAICRALDGHALASLRFNFRGVKGSEGRFSGGPGETDDLVAAMDAMSHWPGIDPGRLGVAGYSFGAGVVLGAMEQLKAARGFAAVAPPLSVVGAMPATINRSVLFMAGANDRISPPVELQRALDGVDGPVKFTQVAGADHMLAGAETGVADAVAQFLAQVLVGPLAD
jgi:alpha/beta superfamily hydrolase